MTAFRNRKLLIFLFLITLLLIDFFIIGRLDPVCRKGQGYGFGYYLGKEEQRMIHYQYGFERIKYNFRNFFQFWAGPTFGRRYYSLKEFLTLDGNSLIWNVSHFLCFFIFSLILLLFFKLNPLSVFLIGLLVNIFHEYIAEGIYVDPSFNDLWLDLLGTLSGILIGIIFGRIRYFPLRRKFGTKN